MTTSQSTTKRPAFLLRPTGNEPAWFQRIDVLVLIAANLGMLAGVLLFGWSLGRVMMTFWAETGVIGYWAIYGLARQAGRGAVFLVPFFIVHFGGFMAGHLVFLSIFLRANFAEGGPGLNGTSLYAALPEAILLVSPVVLILLFAGHGLTHVWRRFRDDAARPALGMGPVYGRVIAMHVALVLGAFVAMLLGSPIWLLALLVVVKIAIDVGALAVTEKLDLKSRPDDVARVAETRGDK